MKQPLFSICIPNYNYEKYIGETIRSVLDQSCQDFEIIVADNCSTDGSLEVVRQFKDPRIKLAINPYNIGFAPNLDKATENAIGQFIILLSSDDLMAPGALAAYAEVIENHRLAKTDGNNQDRLMIYSAIDLIDSDGKITGQRSAQPWLTDTSHLNTPSMATYDGYDVLRRQMTRLECTGRFASMCVSNDIFQSVCGYHTVHTIDPDTFFSYKCLLLNPTVTYIERPLFLYRMHNLNQRSQERKQGAPRLYFDRYYYTIEFNDKSLKDSGVKQEQVINAFLRLTCGRSAILRALRGESRRAWQAFLIASATYPDRYFRMWPSYILLLILLSGPLAPALASIWRRVRHSEKSTFDVER
jgi:glycosyltransferase involved in cell wall biosynthesis